MNREDILKELKKLELDNSQYVVISTSAMVLQGIKSTCGDIDIAVSKSGEEYLLDNFDWELEKVDNLTNNSVYYINGIVNFSKNYYTTDVNYIDDIPVSKIEDTLKLKKYLNREKDQRDIELLTDYLKNGNKNILALAYLGDAIYETYVREYLLSKNIEKVKELQAESINYVSARAQAKFLKELMDQNFFSDVEISIIKRARNHKSRSSKSTDIITYKHSTALEALIGYLYYMDKGRINDIMNYILK